MFIGIYQRDCLFYQTTFRALIAAVEGGNCWGEASVAAAKSRLCVFHELVTYVIRFVGVQPRRAGKRKRSESENRRGDTQPATQ